MKNYSICFIDGYTQNEHFCTVSGPNLRAAIEAARPDLLAWLAGVWGTVYDSRGRFVCELHK